MLGEYTKWKCPICNHFLQRKRGRKNAGNIFYPMREIVEPDHSVEADKILFCSVCDYACKEPNPTKDIDEIILPEYQKKFALEGANETDIHIRCSKCLIRYKFGVIRTDKRMGAALYDDPSLEWYRCNLDEGHPGNHMVIEETPTGITRIEWSDNNDVTSSHL